MVAPLIWGIAALGALALSCDRVEEPQARKPPKPPKNPEPDTGSPSCLGDSYSFSQGGGFLTLCQYSKGREWKFFPQNPWAGEAEQLFSKGIEFCRARKLDVKEVAGLATKIQPARSQSSLNLKEKAYAFITAGILLDIRQDREKPFYQKNRDFVDTVIPKIQEGKLRLKDSNQNGVNPDPFTRAQYSPSENTFFVLVNNLDLDDVRDRATVLHELNHFFQDIQQKKISPVEAETESHLLEADYLIQEEQLLERNFSPDDLEAYIAKKIIKPGTDFHYPFPSALRAEYFLHRKDSKNHKKWLETCRDNSEVTKTLGGILQIINSLRGPGKEQGIAARFLKKYESLRNANPTAFWKAWDSEMKKLEVEKKEEYSKMQKLLRVKPQKSQEELLRQFFRLLQKTVDMIVLERLKVRWQKEEGTEPQTQDKYLTRAAEGIAKLRANRVFLYPMDGV